MKTLQLKLPSLQAVEPLHVIVAKDPLCDYRSISCQVSTYEDTMAKLYFARRTTQFFQAEAIPFALPDDVTEEIQRMQPEVILVPVKTPAWATPIARVQK